MSNSLHSSQISRSSAPPMLFDALEPELKEELTASNPPRSYGDGQIIQHRGSRADGFWLIDEGSVRVGQYLPSGEFRAVVVLGPGDSYGELAVFTGSARIVDAVSRGESKLRFIPAGRFLTALERYPLSNRALLGALSAQLQNSLDQLAGMRRGSNPARLAGLLANMTMTNRTATVTQQELAELLGVTRATANSALRKLEEERLIERGYGTIRAIDHERLALFTLT
jgi:CRP/FNR family transcriptional regulator, cyclic AMP receptor protein